MLLLIAIGFLLKRYGTQAIPLPAPSPTSASFESPIFARDNPSDGCHSRTVLDILWSCLATTFACTWVSVHPNVPFRGEGKWTILRRRIFLMFFSILAPEFMIMWAFKQWRGAVMIREAVNKAIMDVSTDKEKAVRELWTTTHGHFLQMGGFRVSATARENLFWRGSTDIGKRSERPFSDNDNDPLFAYVADVQRQLDKAQYTPEDTTQEFAKNLETRNRILRNLIPVQFFYRHATSEGTWTTDYSPEAELTDDIWEGVLTIDALKRLLSENLITFPAITEDEINDRSKGDALSKGIALLQLTWFIVQIITRAVQGLAITELELTTAALAGLNSVMYIFWWSKPRDMRFPVVIRTKGVEALLAKRTEDVTWNFPEETFDFRKHLWTSIATGIKTLLDAACHFIVNLQTQLLSIVLKSVETAKRFPRRLSFFFSRLRSLLSRSRKSTMKANEGEMPLAVDNEPPRNSENRTKRHASLLVDSAKSATKFAFVPFLCLIYIIDVALLIPIVKILNSDDDRSFSWVFFKEIGGFNVDTEDEIFSMIFHSEDAGTKPLLTTSSIAGALFGAVHCLAWHFGFPSHTEQILWRTASLGIVGSCVVTFLTVLCSDLLDRLNSRVWILFYLAPGGLATLVYPIARITLLVLAVTSLRSLPPSALDTVDWVEFFPHI